MPQIPLTIAQLVRALLRSGMSEYDLAQLLDVSQPTVNRLKNPTYRTSDAVGQRVRALARRSGIALNRKKTRDDAACAV